MREIGVGLLGFGTVGTGLVKTLVSQADHVAERHGLRLRLRGVADIDVTTDRGVRVDPGLLTTDAAALIRDPAVDVVVELIGGTGVARALVLQALRAGKPVVTANKALIARHSREVFEAAAAGGTEIYFGASVGGAIPVIKALREGLAANRILGIDGIVNGTCNYVLTRMEREGLSFDAALLAAQHEGYAEADPSLDVNGFDTAHKAVILASLACDACVPMEGFHIEGIRGVSDLDMHLASALGYRIKLLAVIRPGTGELDLRIHPTLVPHAHMLAAVSDVFNGILVRTDVSGDTLYYGRGAGGVPTSGTLLADLIDVARNLAARSPGRVPGISTTRPRPVLTPICDVVSRHYLRFDDGLGGAALARVEAVLGQHGVAVDAVQALADRGASATALVTTEACDAVMETARGVLRAAPGARDWVARIRLIA